MRGSKREKNTRTTLIEVHKGGGKGWVTLALNSPTLATIEARRGDKGWVAFKTGVSGQH